MPTHGKRATYQSGCRCKRCTEANRLWQREYWVRRRARGGGYPPAVKRQIKKRSRARASARRIASEASQLADMKAIAAVADVGDGERKIAAKLGGRDVGWHEIKVHRRLGRMRRELAQHPGVLPGDERRAAGAPIIITAGALAQRWAMLRALTAE